MHPCHWEDLAQWLFSTSISKKSSKRLSYPAMNYERARLFRDYLQEQKDQLSLKVQDKLLLKGHICILYQYGNLRQ